MKKLFAAAWTFLIVVLCTIPGENLPDVDLVNIDKLAHVGIFAIFGWLWTWALSDKIDAYLPYIIVAGLTFAGLTEIYQGLLPFGRHPSLLDALADTAGLLVGVWSYRIFALKRLQQT